MTSAIVPDPTFIVENHLGSLQSASPEEILHATLFAAAEAIRSTGAGGDIGCWKEILLSVPCCFVVADPGVPLFIRSYNLRQEALQTLETCKRTAHQFAWEIKSFKDAAEVTRGGTKMSAQEVLNIFKQARTASGGEEISAWSITASVMVVSNLKDPRVTNIIDTLEQKFGTKSCLNSLAKLHGLAKLQLDVRTWVAEGLAYLIEIGRLDNDSCSKVALMGSPGASHTPGLFALLEFKLKVRKVILVKAERLGFPRAEMDLVETNSVSHDQYHRASTSEIGWMNQLGAATLACFKFLEAPRSPSQQHHCESTWAVTVSGQHGQWPMVVGQPRSVRGRHGSQNQPCGA
jgi:hypothetical protein